MRDSTAPDTMKRTTTWVLSSSYALSTTTIALNVAVAPLAGLMLAPRPGLATLPVSIMILGVMAASMPASLLMHRIGRRDGFLVGTTIGAVGGASATWAILSGSFLLFCFATACMGILNGFAQFYRFAAAEVAPPGMQARAISWVMAGGVVAGLFGPTLAAGTAGLASVRFAGSYAAVVGLYALSGLLLLALCLPPVEVVSAQAPARRITMIIRDPRVATAVVSSMVGYGVMSLLMTATPLSMSAHGHSFQASAWVIQAHVVAMFAPSFVTGRLIERFSVGRIMATGLVALLGCASINLVGQAVPHFYAALVLLGIGWNFLFISGTTLLTRTHRVSERAKVQGANDVVVFGSAAAGSFLAGYLVAHVGWVVVNMVVLPVLLVAGAVLLLAGTRRPAADDADPVPVVP